jgi:sodium/potassium/calcium exchanger 6
MKFSYWLLFLGLIGIGICSGTLVLEQNEENSCAKVNLVPQNEQCAFVRQNCNDEEHQIGRIDYLSIYYCRLGFLQSLSIIPVVGTLVLFFISLGLTASEFLCPNLYTISKFLNLSDNLAGLTLLALGNSAPDVLSTYKAMSVGSGGLALSELMGAALFITTVVIGSMAVIHPFKVPKTLFIRDGAFFLFVSCVLFVSLFNSQLSVFNCIFLVGAYIVYVVMVVYIHSIAKQQSKQNLRDQRSRNNYNLSGTTPVQLDEEVSDVYLDNFSNLPTIDDLHRNPLTDIVDEENETLEEYDYFVKSHTNASTLPIPVQTGPYGLKVLLRELSKHSQLQGRISLNDVRPSTVPLFGSTHQTPTGQTQSLPHLSRQQQYTHLPIRMYHNDNSDTEDVTTEPTFQFLNYYQLDHLYQLLAPEMDSFADYDLANKIYFIVSLPISILLRVTTPVRDDDLLGILRKLEKKQNLIPSSDSPDDDFDFDLDRSLLMVQSVFGTNFLTHVFLGTFNHYWTFWFPLGLFASLILAYIFKNNYTVHGQNSTSVFHLKILNYFMALMGFFISIMWISIFATEIISILKSVSIIYSLSDDILGITVFALGNSVGDFISNFTIARMGMPLMALGACFGGPLLAICSMGLSGLIIIPRDNLSFYELEITTTLCIMCLTLIVNTALMLFLVSRNQWVLDRRIGVILISNWFVATTVCIIIELRK